MTKIARKLSLDKVLQIFVELHSKDQSSMNQRISDQDIYRIKDGTREEYSVGPNLQRKIKTNNYNCNEDEQYVEQTTCLNHYYMSKLNCTFPWLNSTKQSQEKCGSNNFIKDLIDLISDVSAGKYSIF